MIKEIKMLYPKSDWKVDNSYEIEKIVNKDGYYMFTSSAGVFLHNDKGAINISFSLWILYVLLANWRVNSLTNKHKLSLLLSTIPLLVVTTVPLVFFIAIL